MRALVVDDSRAMRMILKKHLRDCGFEDVHEAGDGLEALEVLERLQSGRRRAGRLEHAGDDGLEFVQHVRADLALRRRPRS